MSFDFSNSSANDLVRVLLKNFIKREKTPPELTRISNGGWFCKFKIKQYHCAIYSHVNMVVK